MCSHINKLVDRIVERKDITSGGKPLTSILGNGLSQSNSNTEAPESQ